MRISVNRFSFEAPQGFEDITNYTFKDRKRQELLTVTFGARPPEARDLHSLLATRRDNLEMVPAPVKVEGEQDTRVDGLPGRMLWFTFEDAGVSYRERWAVALPHARHLSADFLCGPGGRRKSRGALRAHSEQRGARAQRAAVFLRLPILSGDGPSV